MIETPVDSLTALCEPLGLRGPLSAKPIGHGRNSRVECISNADGQWVLKRYHASSSHQRDRLASEFGFLHYLNTYAVAHVARALAFDRDANVALYSRLRGERIERVSDDHIRQAGAFIQAINVHGDSSQARALPQAADACTTWGDHLTLVRNRVARLTSLEPVSDIEREAHDWVTTQLVPAWRALEAGLAAHALAAGRVQPILSPSDFGFHNALDDDGELAFVDFEYAGWDDPAKLACDFICQPEVPVSHAQGMQFVDMLAQHVAPRSALVERVTLLVPVHRLKWCCILLNEFQAEHRARRLHAGIDGQGLLATQLDKARRYFATHTGNTQD